MHSGYNDQFKLCCWLCKWAAAEQEEREEKGEQEYEGEEEVSMSMNNLSDYDIFTLILHSSRVNEDELDEVKAEVG